MKCRFRFEALQSSMEKIHSGNEWRKLNPALSIEVRAWSDLTYLTEYWNRQTSAQVERSSVPSENVLSEVFALAGVIIRVRRRRKREVDAPRARTVSDGWTNEGA